MPIYEYRCRTCDAVTGALVFTDADRAAVRCKRCSGADLDRVPSRFAHHRTEGQRLRDLDTRSLPGDSFYRDRRNIGLWAKKRAQQLGVDLGSDYDEAVERARTSRHVEDLDL